MNPLIILFSVITAFFFRVIPFCIGRNRYLVNQDTKFYRFLSYSSQAMLGVMCFEAMFGKTGYGDIVSRLAWNDVIAVALILTAFVVVARTKNILFIFGINSTLFVLSLVFLTP